MFILLGNLELYLHEELWDLHQQDLKSLSETHRLYSFSIYDIKDLTYPLNIEQQKTTEQMVFGHPMPYSLNGC